MSKVFMERRREIMEIRGRTNQEVADACGLDRKMVIRMRNDPTYDPRMSAVTKMADDMGVPVSWLLGRDDEVETITIETEKVVREIVEVPEVKMVEVHRRFFNPKWEEG